MKLLKFGFLLTMFFSTSVKAWNAAGHLIIAQIAYNNLTPEVKARADKLIAITREQYPRSPDFITASLWADDLRAQGDDRYNKLHYVTHYMNMKGEKINRPVDSPNVITAINDAQKILQDDSQSLEAQSLALRGLIHWVGDIHQPLHCISRVSKHFPQGDRGGTLFPLNKKSGYRNLHAYWDGGMGDFPYLKRPKTAAQTARVQYFAAEFMRTVPTSQSDAQILDPNVWAQESVTIATEFVYPYVYPKDSPSLKYYDRTRMIAKQRVVLAGLRLAELLNGSL